MANCPHCGVENDGVAAFCVQCGKALPESMPSGPRVVSGDQMAATAVGQNLQADQLRKQAGQAFKALIVVAVLSVIGGVVFFFILKSGPKEVADQAPVVLAINLVLAAIYAGLAIWARVNPLPAAIVGLVLFVSVHVISAVIDPMSIAQGIIVKIIIVVVLVKAIQAGVKYRQLRAQMATSSV